MTPGYQYHISEKARHAEELAETRRLFQRAEALLPSKGKTAQKSYDYYKALLHQWELREQLATYRE